MTRVSQIISSIFGDRRRFFTLPYWFDLFLAGIIGGMVSLGIDRVLFEWEEAKRTETFRLHLNRAGVGYPANLFSEVRRENTKLTLTFAPATLERVRVCEYYEDTQENFKLILDRYFARYSACFDVVQKDALNWEVRPNRESDHLRSKQVKGQEQFGCRCTSAQMK